MIYRKKTKQIIAESFIQLMEESDSDKISVTDISDNCTVSRRTFYNYFLDKENVLVWIFSNEGLIFGKPQWNQYEIFYEVLLHQLQIIFEHSVFYGRVLHTFKGKALYEKEIKNRIMSWNSDLQRGAKDEYMIDFICSGYVAIIAEWIQSKSVESPEKLLSSLKKCIPLWIYESKKKDKNALQPIQLVQLRSSVHTIMQQ